MTTAHFPPLPERRLPALSIVVAARDEAANIEEALDSLLSQDYPELEIVVVDDRSTDGTSEIIDTLKRSHPRAHLLTVLHNQELPEGWLGKVHALHLGVRVAKHSLLLFTDADVGFEPDALQRAVTARCVLGADHLAIAPRFQTQGFWEPVLVAYFCVLFSLRFQPSAVHRKKRRFVGVGAFNLLTRSMIERLEYLEPLRLQVVDDLFLGRMVKARGGRQFALLGQSAISVRWFRGLRGLVTGLEKNAYAGLDYNLPKTIAASVVCSLPAWGLVLAGLLAPWPWAVILYLLQALLTTVLARAMGLPCWTGLTTPLASLPVAFTILRSAFLAERRQAVIWRDTCYPLRQLRSAHHQFLEKERL